MAISTDLDVANLALDQLGVAQISDLADGDYVAVDQNNLDLVVGTLMERHEWKFLHTYAQLAAATAPSAQWTNAFDLPGNLLGAAPTALYPTSGVGVTPTTRWQRVGSQVFTDHAELWALYKIDRPVIDWPSAFRMLAVFALAAHWAMPVTENRSLAEAMMLMAYGGPQDDGRGGKFREAVNADVWSDPSFSLLMVNDPIQNARFGADYTDWRR